MSFNSSNHYFPRQVRHILGDPPPEAQYQGGYGQLFECQCSRSDRGKVTEKREISPIGRDHFAYAYDQAGHLTEVHKNGELAEYYEYDESGRRIRDFRSWASDRRSLTYNWDGSLLRVEAFRRARPELSPGLCEFSWTDKGQLASMVRDGHKDTFFHGSDSRLDRALLDRALLADGTDIRYHYGQELLPVKITVNGAKAAECQWTDKIRLTGYKDALHGLNYDFIYGDKRAPLRVVVSGGTLNMYQATGISVQCLELNIRVDQLDSMRALSLPDGRVIKYLEYDSFGNVISDSRPDWYFPIGFACGLHDPWTGFVRFGFRDYDPRFGRFTAKDPIGDTGGDHDLWDYCIDDPVSMNDPSGLVPPPVLFGLGMLGATSVAGAGVYGAAAAVDGMEYARSGKTAGAIGGVNEIAPITGGTIALGAVPGMVALSGPGAVTGMQRLGDAYAHYGQLVGASLTAHGADKVLGPVARFAEGMISPAVSPAPSSLMGQTGAAVKQGYDLWQHERNMRYRAATKDAFTVKK